MILVDGVGFSFASSDRPERSLISVGWRNFLALDPGQSYGIAYRRLPLLEVHAEVLEGCLRAGEGDFDNSAVIEEVRRRRS